LSLLVERFNIPEPSQVFEETQCYGDGEKSLKNSQREDWKRYRKVVGRGCVEFVG